MSEDTTAEDMRYELGRDYAQRGEQLHDGASEEFQRGYSSYRGFGSNVSPRKFGKGAVQASTWTCVCGHVNNSRVRRKVAGVGVVCWQCGLGRKAAEQADN